MTIKLRGKYLIYDLNGSFYIYSDASFNSGFPFNLRFITRTEIIH